jgi:hypothetical protein
MSVALIWVHSDGGRAAAGYKGSAPDCVARAIALATGKPYKEVYDELNDMVRRTSPDGTLRKAGAARGIPNWIASSYLSKLGWEYVGLLKATYAHPALLQPGVIVVDAPRHLACVVDGVLYDTFDSAHTPVRRKARKISGYYRPKKGTIMGEPKVKFDPSLTITEAPLKPPKKVGRPFAPPDYEKRMNFNMSLPPSEVVALRNLGFGSASQAVSKLLALYLQENGEVNHESA